jgi:hypothetical protein
VDEYESENWIKWKLVNEMKVRSKSNGSMKVRSGSNGSEENMKARRRRRISVAESGN